MKFLKSLLEKKYLIYQLVKRDFTSNYVDSYLGLIWAILEPLATTIILALVFSMGFRAGEILQMPFFVFMFSGMVAFNYFSKAAGEGISVIKNYSFLVKKVDFQLAILPVVKIISLSLFHGIMLLLLVLVLLVHGFYPSWYWLQVVYYYCALSVLLLGFTWLFSSISIFIPDVGRFISIALSFLFYLSPVFWHSSQIPEEYASYVKLNPLHYIVTGYRDSFLYHKPFWYNWQEGLYFWITTFVFLSLGVLVFKKLKPHFADVI